jgi:hypothetical protein
MELTCVRRITRIVVPRISRSILADPLPRLSAPEKMRVLLRGGSKLRYDFQVSNPDILDLPVITYYEIGNLLTREGRVLVEQRSGVLGRAVFRTLTVGCFL